jgi:hypothetical protein
MKSWTSGMLAAGAIAIGLAGSPAAQPVAMPPECY